MEEPLLSDAVGNGRSELPSWLREEDDVIFGSEGNGNGEASGRATEEPPPDADTTITGSERGGGDGAVLLPWGIALLRVANTGAAGLLIACSVLAILGLPNLSQWILAAYTSFSGLLLLSHEIPVKFLRTAIALNFGFLYSPILRLLFQFLMASVAWLFDSLTGLLACVALVATALLNFYVLCRYPAYASERENVMAEEERRVDALVREQKRRAVREIAERWVVGDP